MVGSSGEWKCRDESEHSFLMYHAVEITVQLKVAKQSPCHSHRGVTCVCQHLRRRRSLRVCPCQGKRRLHSQSVS